MQTDSSNQTHAVSAKYQLDSYLQLSAAELVAQERVSTSKDSTASTVTDYCLETFVAASCSGPYSSFLNLAADRRT